MLAAGIADGAKAGRLVLDEDGPATVATGEGSSEGRSSRTAARSGKSDERQYEKTIHAELAAGRGDRALELINATAAELPRKDRHSLAGRAHFLAGRWESARRELSAALRDRPNDAQDLYWLGRSLLAGGAPASAADRFQQAWRNGLDSAELHLRWAEALEAAGQIMGDIEQRAWDEAKDGPARPGIMVTGGVIFAPVPNRPDRVVVCPAASALYQAQQAARLEPGRGDALFVCARLWAAAGRHEDATAFYARAAGALSGEPLRRCREGWAASLLALGDIDNYLQRAREALSCDGPPEDRGLAECHERAAEAAGQRGDLARQIRLLEEAARLAPDPSRQLALAEALLQANRVDEAVARMQVALERCSDPILRGRIQQRLRRAAFLSHAR